MSAHCTHGLEGRRCSCADVFSAEYARDLSCVPMAGKPIFYAKNDVWLGQAFLCALLELSIEKAAV